MYFLMYNAAETLQFPHCVITHILISTLNRSMTKGLGPRGAVLRMLRPGLGGRANISIS